METIASTLPTCSVRQLAYSTFSILQLYYDGQAYLAEFDNPQCIFIRGGQLVSLEKTERTISGKTVYESRFGYASGDIFALISDGVILRSRRGSNLGWSGKTPPSLCSKAKSFIPPPACAVVKPACDNLYKAGGDDLP